MFPPAVPFSPQLTDVLLQLISTQLSFSRTKKSVLHDVQMRGSSSSQVRQFPIQILQVSVI